MIFKKCIMKEETKKLEEAFQKDFEKAQILTDVFIDAMKNDPRTQKMVINSCYPVMQAAENVIAIAVLASAKMAGKETSEKLFKFFSKCIADDMLDKFDLYKRLKEGGEYGN